MGGEERFPVEESRPVWHADGEDFPNQYVEFTQEFFCEEEAVTFFLSCDSRAVIWLEDKQVGFALYDGTKEWGVYEVFDLAPYLAGEAGKTRRLKILVYYQGEDSNCYTAGSPYVLFGAKLRTGKGYGKTLFYSGENTFARRDTHYRTGEVEKNQTGYVWHYDALAKEEKGFEGAKILRRGKEHYGERPILRQVLSGRNPAVLFREGYSTGEGEWGDRYLIYDLGEECSGFLELEFTAKAGSLLVVSWGEHLTEGRVRKCVGGRHFLCSYRCKGGREIFFHPFHRIGLRYLELEISAGEDEEAAKEGRMDPVVCHYAGIRPLGYPVKETGSFQCADPVHRKIYDTSVRTLRLCMHEHFEDCPWREQALYALDAANQMLCGYYCFGEFRFAAASLELLGREMGEDGFLPLHVPGRDGVTIPYYTFLWGIALQEYLQYAKDRALPRRLWTKIRRAVDLRLKELEEGLLTVPRGTCYWNFYEWNSVLSGEPIYREKPLERRVDAPYMMSFLMMLEACGKMARALGEGAYGAQLARTADQIRGACHRLFWDEEGGCYHTYAYERQGRFQGERGKDAELVQAFAVLCGVAGERERSLLLPGLTEGRESWEPCTLAMMRYKYEALLQEKERYAPWVFEDIRSIWGGMLRQGATSFWETQKGAADFEGAGSLCHGWSAIPVYFYHKYYQGPF